MSATAAVVRAGLVGPMCPACGAVRPSRGERRPDAALPAAIAAALTLVPALTPRERVVFELLGHGYDNRSIAGALGISERTAKRHITAILDKLKLESRLQAGLAALLGSYPPPVEEAL
jgi:DNA-binding NarL/FixJ family response regulator